MIQDAGFRLQREKEKPVWIIQSEKNPVYERELE
jgi:hypothetical protein